MTGRQSWKKWSESNGEKIFYTYFNGDFVLVGSIKKVKINLQNIISNTILCGSFWEMFLKSDYWKSIFSLGF